MPAKPSFSMTDKLACSSLVMKSFFERKLAELGLDF